MSASGQDGLCKECVVLQADQDPSARHLVDRIGHGPEHAALRVRQVKDDVPVAEMPLRSPAEPRTAGGKTRLEQHLYWWDRSFADALARRPLRRGTPFLDLYRDAVPGSSRSTPAAVEIGDLGLKVDQDKAPAKHYRNRKGSMNRK